MPGLIDMTGWDMSKHGVPDSRLIVIKRAPNKGAQVQWLCKCICGNEIVVDGRRLRTGNTKSCGCLKQEEDFKKINQMLMNRTNNTPSKGEQKIMTMLKEAAITFEREKVFEDFRNARYDFYLPTMNILIEYDGMQHFKWITFFNKTRTEFLKYQEKDRQKNSYALAHNYLLYRIPEWELSNINSIADLFSPKFMVKTRWHNDQAYREYKRRGL